MSAFVINPYSFAAANITDFAFVASATDNANASSYTFSNVSLGAEDANRSIIIAFATRVGSASTSVSSATVAGISATSIVQHFAIDDAGGTNTDDVAILVAAVPSGTTGTVVINLTNGGVRGALSVYRVVSKTALTTIDTATFGGGASASMSVDVEPNSIVVAVGSSRLGGSGGHTWNLSNTDVNIGVESNAMTFSTASEQPTAASTKTYTASASTGFFMVTAAASFK